MFYDNKYKTLYFKIIESARKRNDIAVGELHHVIPRCLGGGDEDSNIVLLTYREHYLAHALLVKMNPSRSLIHAFWCMSFMNRKKYQNARLYEAARAAYVESIRGKNHWMMQEGSKKKISDSWDEKRRDLFKEKTSGDNHWTKKRDMSEHAKLMRSSLNREKMIENGKKSSFVTDNPMKKSSIVEQFKKPKEIVVCPHCEKVGGKPVMTRYHFDKCKIKIQKEFV